MNLRFLALIRGMREGGVLKIFFCFPKGSVTSPQSFDKQGDVFSARRVFVFD